MNKALASLLFFALPAYAETDIRFFNVIYENDIFFQEDGGYTNGFALNYARGFDAPFSERNAPSLLLPLVEHAGFNRASDRMRGISYQFGQIMSTPEDITTPELIADQQPYAGLLMGRINFYGLTEQSSRRLGFIAGVVGPASGAEQSQKLVHHITGSKQPQGWDNQLKTEPVFRLESSRTRRLWTTQFGRTLGGDVSAIAEGGIGNLASDLGFGMRLRFGARLNESFPIAMDLPGREINPTAGMHNTHWHFFINLEGRYVFNDILIEGNSYQDSHGVELTHEQVRLGFGASINLGNWAFTYEGAFTSKEYATQPGTGKFGSISFTYRLR
ncbi:lipid A deacylase LpxR family protein [Teredinibacter turnerae]|uniref:lipid A deacylase LpxR family protein n=1 Tax=Teredinibacter turnerae TaxID=2426 RepID=UPI000370A119|nr:lipid A deacylase LpxR family protein [Teredinibacter turnerae]